jgi:hypothetical protein
MANECGRPVFSFLHPLSLLFSYWRDSAALTAGILDELIRSNHHSVVHGADGVFYCMAMKRHPFLWFVSHKCGFARVHPSYRALS